MQHRSLKLKMSSALTLNKQRKRVALRLLFSILLFTFVSTFTACSYSTDFVVFNTSDQPIEVRYKVSAYPSNHFEPRIPPAILTIEQARDGDVPWQKLSATQYELDSENRTISIRVMPDQALRVESVHRRGMDASDEAEAKDFYIDEITIDGAKGVVRFEGNQARKSFIPETKRLFTLKY
jgi:hypothetical protein